ncbi:MULTISPECIES: DMT family transporter [Cobetia]|uniref:DMT family transporter n=1 Tax=Cobetia TaxID=204286 RepID=UPI00158372A2|nr:MULTISPECIES: DMT family transporter [Cobetia]MDI4662563.1 DMT family transporter [Cobetia sp. BMC6]MDL2192983.1 DMT family transporter [Cobetia sp. LC6]NUJ57892.1 DMT family transporter [Cobetia marina]
MNLAELSMILMAVAAGAMMPIQAGVNSTLALQTHSSLMAAMVSFVVGSIALVVIVLAMRLPMPGVGALKAAPWWSWTGGLLGAFFVAASVILVPKLGAATMMATFLAGQLTASVVLDHFGWATFPQHDLSLGRVAGVLLLFAGVFLIRRY